MSDKRCVFAGAARNATICVKWLWHQLHSFGVPEVVAGEDDEAGDGFEAGEGALAK